MKKIVLAPDSFKGSLSAKQVCEIEASVIRERIPDCEIVELPLSDGGEGCLKVLAQTLPGIEKRSVVQDPLGNPVFASWRLLDSNLAMVELAEASGLQRLKPSDRNPMYTSTSGCGQQLLEALDCGAKKIILSIGGSATNDGGMGIATALGAVFLDENGRELSGIGDSLAKVAQLDLSRAIQRLKGVSIEVWCDVENPLLGETGCAKVFAPQKGASAAQVEELENGMHHLVSTLHQEGYTNLIERGAAGGVCLLLSAIGQVSVRSGAEAVLDLLSFDERIAHADWIITGEGCTDESSLHGKLIQVVFEHAVTQQVDCALLSGDLAIDSSILGNLGMKSVGCARPKNCSVERAMAQAEPLLKEAMGRLLEQIQK